MTEQRRQKRIAQENKVTVHVLEKQPDAQSIPPFFALTKDLSLEGVKIITENKIPPETLVKVELVLEKTRKIICLTGRVKWARSLYDEEVYELGIEYVDQQPRKIIDLLEHLYRK